MFFPGFIFLLVQDLIQTPSLHLVVSIIVLSFKIFPNLSLSFLSLIFLKGASHLFCGISRNLGLSNVIFF